MIVWWLSMIVLILGAMVGVTILRAERDYRRYMRNHEVVKRPQWNEDML